MKYLKKYDLFEGFLPKDKKIPGLPEEFPDDYSESHDLILKIFGIFNIVVKSKYNLDFDEYKDVDLYVTYYIKDGDGNSISLSLLNNLDKSELYIDRDDGDDRDDRDDVEGLIEDPLDLINYISEIDRNDIAVPLFKKINESELMNEKLTDDDIMKDPNTNHKEKEILMNKNSLDDLKKYKSMKGRFDSMFSNLEGDIDSPTIFKLIDGNKFLKEYVSLLSKKRDLELLKSSIIDKNERLKELKKEIQDLNLNHDENDPETKSGLNDQMSKLVEDIKNSQSRISNYSDVSNLFKKWDNRIIKLMRDLEQGTSVLDSTLDDLR